MNSELINKRYTKSQEQASQLLENMLDDAIIRYRTFLLVGEVGNGKSFLMRKLSESKKYEYIDVVDHLIRIGNRQDLEKMQPEWFVRYLEDLVLKSDASVVIFDELESAILPNKNPLVFTKVLLGIMDKRNLGKGIVIVLSISDHYALPSLDFIRENWSSKKLIFLSLEGEDVKIIARNYRKMWDLNTKPYDIVKAKIWRDFID